jgi:hypothetical protein
MNEWHPWRSISTWISSIPTWMECHFQTMDVFHSSTFIHAHIPIHFHLSMVLVPHFIHPHSSVCIYFLINKTHFNFSLVCSVFRIQEWVHNGEDMDSIEAYVKFYHALGIEVRNSFLRIDSFMLISILKSFYNKTLLWIILLGLVWHSGTMFSVFSVPCK